MQEYNPQVEMNFQREMQEKQQSGDPNSIYADTLREEKIKNVIAHLSMHSLLSFFIINGWHAHIAKRFTTNAMMFVC